MSYRQTLSQEINLLLRLIDKLPSGSREAKTLQRKALFLMDAVKTHEFEYGWEG